MRGSWARDWGLGALCSPRTELMGTFPPALECMFTNGSPQMLSQAFTPFPVFHSLPSPSAEPWAGSLPEHSDSTRRNSGSLIHPGLIHPGHWAAVDGQPCRLQGTDFLWGSLTFLHFLLCKTCSEQQCKPFVLTKAIPSRCTKWLKDLPSTWIFTSYSFNHGLGLLSLTSLSPQTSVSIL